MKPYVYLLLFCSFVPHFVHSQRIDSLETQLKKSPVDTGKVNLLIDLAMEYWSSAPEKTIAYSNEALALSEKLDYTRGMARSYQSMGVYHWQKNNYPASLDFYTKSRDLYEKIGDKKGFASAISNTGIVYGEQGNYGQALENYTQAISIFREINDQSRVGSLLNSMGIIHKKQQNYDESLSFYKQAQEIWKKLGDLKSVGGAHINMAAIYNRQKKYALAQQNATEALIIFEGFKDLNGQIICRNDLGDISFQMGDYEKAQASYEKALDLNRTFKSKRLMVTSYNGLGNVYHKLKQNNNAIVHFQKAYVLADSLGLKPALQLASEGLSKVYGETGNYADAYRFQKLSSTLRDSLFNAENANKIANLRVHYESQKKEDEIKLLQKEKDLGYATRNTVAVTLAAVIILLALAFNRQKLKQTKDRELNHVQRQLAETEIRNRIEKEEQLTAELEFRNKALTTHTLNLIQKNGILEEIRSIVSTTLQNGKRDENSPLLSKLLNLIDYSFTQDKDWEEFKMYFEGVHKDFFLKLKKENPELSGGELRLCALIRLNLNLKEAAALLNISPDSVKTARHRLRKKLNLSEESSLSDYLMAV
ncbi:tetratricopeptide repeat protein [Dyadobacter pollutisoli]|uniref:Tetratricopeptide repeat protein n=1 Tax=Dyadobacter pollutisoli TaxID=2910158 RepID=A0A9E8NHM7_9BACT|nr:tetratricopeptide repeat protein [Dyadobacter pollutisoli]WAC14214.1 tetratricopeptide repeat protein [Dyadobacter pollutisoli]